MTGVAQTSDDDFAPAEICVDHTRIQLQLGMIAHTDGTPQKRDRKFTPHAGRKSLQQPEGMAFESLSSARADAGSASSEVAARSLYIAAGI